MQSAPVPKKGVSAENQRGGPLSVLHSKCQRTSENMRNASCLYFCRFPDAHGLQRLAQELVNAELRKRLVDLQHGSRGRLMAGRSLQRALVHRLVIARSARHRVGRGEAVASQRCRTFFGNVHLFSTLKYDKRQLTLQ